MKGKISMVYLLFIIYVLFSATGLILFKLGTASTGIEIFGINITFKMVIGLVCYIISFLLWLVIASKYDLTLALPISVGAVNTLVFIGSSIFLKEDITFTKIIGIFLIITGILFITYKK